MDKKRIKDMESKLKATVLIEQGYQDQIAELKADFKQQISSWDATIGKMEVHHKKQSAELEEIVKAVAHIGVDFGYGEFELDDSHIKKARELLEKSDE